MASLRVAQVLQEPPTATLPTATMTSRVSNWQMIEESEAEVILDLEGRQMDVNQPSQLGSTAPLGVMIPRAITPMTVADWGQCRITWGEKAQGEHLHEGMASGSILLSMGGGPFCQPYTRSSRFCEVLSSADGSRPALQLRSVTKHPVVNSAFHDDVAKTRKFLNQNVPPKLFNPAVADSILHASRILEETFCASSVEPSPEAVRLAGSLCRSAQSLD